MKQLHKNILKGLSVAGMVVAANATWAETVAVDASVTVNNAIDFSVTGELNFGEVRATAVNTAATCAGLTLGTSNLTLTSTPRTASTPFATACGIATTGVGALQSVGGTVTRPVFTISGVAAFATLVLTLPSAPIDLLAPTGPDTPQFQLIDFTARKTSGTAAAVTTSIMTDADGGATFTVGATLITDPTEYYTAATGTPFQYKDMAYVGSFDVTVTY